MRKLLSRFTSERLKIAVAVGVSAICAREAFAGFDAKDTKILDLSWTTPSAPTIGTALSSRQNLPFDGIIADLVQNNPAVGNGNPPDLFAWRTWGPTINAASFSQSISSLGSSSPGRFKESLLRFNVAGQHVDWFDSASVVANAQLASSIMAQGGFKGIFLDTEYYLNVSPGTPFDYNSQPQKSSHTFAQYQARAREVGAQVMSSLKSQNPDVQVMMTFGYQTAGTNPANWANEGYGLLPAFLDGMLDQAGPNNLLVDGWENGYGYNSTAQYDAAYNTMRVSNASQSANASGFANNHRAGFAFWLDRGPDNNSTVWDPNNIANNSYSPAQFQFAMQEAAKRSDKYVWVYSQIASWYNGNIPQPYIDALKNVRKVGGLERFRGTIKDTANWQAHTEASGAIVQNNSLFIDALNFSTASQADYTTKTATVGIGGLVSVEVTNTTATSNTGLWAAAKIGLILSNDSGGSGTSALLDSRSLSLIWSNSANAMLAGVSDTAGLNQYTTVASGDQPNGTNYIYQIERLSATTAKFTLMNPNGGAIIGTPQVLAFDGLPGDLFVSLFAQAGDATFNNVWIAAAVYSGWSVNGSGDWNSSLNWSTTYVPNAVDAKALLGGAIDAPRTVYTDVAITVGSLKFDNANGYQIAGQGSLSLDVSAGTASIDVMQGSHKINLPLFVKDNTTANIQSGATLKISNPMTLTNGATLTKIGAGTLSIEAPVYTAASAALASSAGVTNVSTNLGSNVSVNVSGGTFNFSSSQQLAALNVSGGLAKVGPGSNVVVSTKSLALSGNGKIDLLNGRVIVDYADASAFPQIKRAIDAGSLISSLQIPGATVAFGEASDLFGSVGGSFAGNAVDGSAILTAYTYAGDASLDGVVDSIDFNQFINHYGQSTDLRWTQGDFNGDGKINTLDFNSLAGNFGLSVPAAPSLGAVVPEPSMAGIIVAASLLGLFRKNRRI